MYDKNRFQKVDDKKVLRKIRSRWVTVSIALLGLLSGGIVAARASVGTDNHTDVTNIIPENLQEDPVNSAKTQGQLKSSVTRQASSLHSHIIRHAGAKIQSTKSFPDETLVSLGVAASSAVTLRSALASARSTLGMDRNETIRNSDQINSLNEDIAGKNRQISSVSAQESSNVVRENRDMNQRSAIYNNVSNDLIRSLASSSLTSLKSLSQRDSNLAADEGAALTAGSSFADVVSSAQGDVADLKSRSGGLNQINASLASKIDHLNGEITSFSDDLNSLMKKRAANHGGKKQPVPKPSSNNSGWGVVHYVYMDLNHSVISQYDDRGRLNDTFNGVDVAKDHVPSGYLYRGVSGGTPLGIYNKVPATILVRVTKQNNRAIVYVKYEDFTRGKQQINAKPSLGSTITSDGTVKINGTDNFPLDYYKYEISDPGTLPNGYQFYQFDPQHHDTVLRNGDQNIIYVVPNGSIHLVFNSRGKNLGSDWVVGRTGSRFHLADYENASHHMPSGYVVGGVTDYQQDLQHHGEQESPISIFSDAWQTVDVNLVPKASPSDYRQESGKETVSYCDVKTHHDVGPQRLLSGIRGQKLDFSEFETSGMLPVGYKFAGSASNSSQFEPGGTIVIWVKKLPVQKPPRRMSSISVSYLDQNHYDSVVPNSRFTVSGQVGSDFDLTLCRRYTPFHYRFVKILGKRNEIHFTNWPQSINVMVTEKKDLSSSASGLTGVATFTDGESVMSSSSNTAVNTKSMANLKKFTDVLDVNSNANLLSSRMSSSSVASSIRPTSKSSGAVASIVNVISSDLNNPVLGVDILFRTLAAGDRSCLNRYLASLANGRVELNSLNRLALDVRRLLSRAERVAVLKKYPKNNK